MALIEPIDKIFDLGDHEHTEAVQNIFKLAGIRFNKDNVYQNGMSIRESVELGQKLSERNISKLRLAGKKFFRARTFISAGFMRCFHSKCS